MLALSLTVALFIFWSFTGRSLLAGLNLKLGILRSWLLAPGIGLSIMVLGLMLGSQRGLPIGSFAWTLTWMVAILAGGIFIWKRPSFPTRALIPFISAILFSVIWTEWPALKFSFNWVSFITDDFINYCLGSERFKDFGFYRIPNSTELAGTDYTQAFWFMHALSMIRFGVEHQLAWLSSLTGLPAVKVFMPTIIAFGLVQISGIAALVLTFGKWRKHAQWTVIFLVISPLFCFADLYEVIAQVGGLSLMLTALALLTAYIPGRKRKAILMHAIPTVIVGSALAVFYPEVTPFVILSLGGLMIFEWIKTKRIPGSKVVLLTYSILGLIIVLRHNLIAYLYTFGNQLFSGIKLGDLSLSQFPYFLIPSGVSALFGFQPMNFDLNEPFGSLLIALGLILLCITFIFALGKAWKLEPWAWLFLVQLAVGLRLFQTGIDFGIYKLAMFIQPALMAALAGFILTFKKPKHFASYAALVFFGITAWTTTTYTRSSAGEKAGIIREMDRVSETLDHRPLNPGQNTPWIGSFDNFVAMKLAAYFYKGVDLKLPSRDIWYIGKFLNEADWPLMQYYPHLNMFPEGHKLVWDHDVNYVKKYTAFNTKFSLPTQSSNVVGYLNVPNQLSLFNKFKADPKSWDKLFVLTASKDVENQLIFIHSTLGNHYYLVDRHVISFFQQESDPFDDDSPINSIGRFFLLRIEHPTDLVYLRLALTKTFMGIGQTQWSKSAAISGTTEVPLDIKGDGAFNRFIGPIKPLWIDGFAYVALDFGQGPKAFYFKRTGLKALFNSRVPLDYRLLVGYARDISAVSPHEYKTLDRPTRIAHFPNDLVHARDLEFSGAYEDGWISQNSEFVLGECLPGQSISINGYVPNLAHVDYADAKALVTINGNKTYSFDAKPGYFNWILPVTNPSSKTSVEIHFNKADSLSGADGRPVGGKLTSMSIETYKSLKFTDTYQSNPPTSGIDSDGWCSKSIDLDIPRVTQSKHIILEIEYPGWPDVHAENKLTAQLDNTTQHVFSIKSGIQYIDIPLDNNLSATHIHIESQYTLKIPSPDNRMRSFRLRSVYLEKRQ